MQYFVSIKTDCGKQVNHIQAKNLVHAIKTVNTYNEKHPTWEMRLMQVCPMPDHVLMPVYTVSE